MGGSGGKPDHGSVGRGSGGASGSGRGSGGSAESGFDCPAFRTTTTLRSPKQDVLAGIEPGGHLLLVSMDGAVIATTQEGDTAGSIVVPELDELVTCIEQGIVYQAEVRSVRGGACVVEISVK